MKVLAGVALLVSMVPAIVGAGVIYSQDFSGSSGFTLTPGGANTITTNTGSMVYTRTQGSVLGAMIQPGLPAVPGFFSVKMDLNAFLTFAGSWSISMYDSTALTFRELVSLSSKGTGLKVTGGLDAQFTGNLGVANLAMFVNNTTSTQTYTDPAGASSSIDAGNVSVWAGNVLQKTSAVAGMNSANSFNQLRFLFPATSAIKGTFNIDNIVIESIPEPATIGLVSFAAVGLLLFRRFHLMKK